MPERFVFEEHIIRFIDPRIDKRKKIAERLPDFLGRRFKTSFIQKIEAQQKENDKHYEKVLGVLRSIVSQGRVDISCEIGGNQAHKIIITGSGLETFKMREEPRYTISQDKKSKETVLPVSVGSREDEIRIYDYPSPSTPLNRFSKISLDYRFSTEISLGGNCSSYGERRFSKKPEERVKYDGDLKSKLAYFFYGEPGKVAFRIGDAIHQELKDSVLGTWTYDNAPRDKIDIQAIVLCNDLVVYQGNIHVTGSFPFYIDRDNEGDFERESPKTPADLKIK
jgi:hypothetical protein